MGQSEIFIALGLGLNITTMIVIFFSSKPKEVVASTINSKKHYGISFNKSAILFTGLLLLGFGFQVIGALINSI